MRSGAILLLLVTMAARVATAQEPIRPGPFAATALGAVGGAALGAVAAYAVAAGSSGLLESQDAGAAGVVVSVVIVSLPFLGAAAGATIARRSVGGKQHFGGSVVGAFVGAGLGALLIAGQRRFAGPHDTASVLLFTLPFAGLTALAGW